MRIDFRHYVDERTKNYTSRPWLIEEIAAWLRDPGSSRYFFLTGEPGSGKTALTGYLWLLSSGALPPGETHVPPGSIAAHHFCFARDLQSITPAVFAESIAEQLATAIPAFDEVRRKPHQKDLKRIDSTIIVSGANTGQITGVAFPHEGDPESAFAQLVRTPLEDLYAQGFDRDLFILVDALDEARQFSGKRNIADLVTLAEGMRSRVRFLLTSRPDTELLPRLPVDARRHIDLSDAAVRERTRVDVRRHLGRSVAGDDAIRGKLAGGISETLFVSMLADKADGNFLWTRIVLDVIRDHDGPVTAAVLDALPSGLHNTYLGLLRRIAPDAAQWQDGPAALVFGTLAVALEELTLPQLAAYTGVPGPRLTLILEQAFQLLDVSPPEGGGTYAIYHRSLVDFLLEPAADHAYALNPLDQHRRIADTWIGQVDGPVPRWKDSDGYTLRHISAHLFALRHAERYAAWLRRLVCREWRELKERELRADVSFANDVTLAVDAASEAWPQQLVEQLFGIAVLTNVRSRGESLPEAGLTLLVRLGRRAEALAYAEMRPAPSGAWIAIAKTLVEEDPSTAESLARRAIGAGNDANEAWAILVRALGRQARFDEARQLLATPTLGDKHAARETLAGHAVAAGQLDVAEEIAETMEKGYTRSATVAKIVLAAVARRDWPRVQRLFASLAGDRGPYDLVDKLLEQSAGAEAEMVAILREHGTEEDLERARWATQRFAEAGDDERALAAAAALNDGWAKRMVRSARIRQIARSEDAEQIAAFRAGASDDEIAELDEVRATAFVIAGREADAALVLQQTPERRRVTAAVFALLRHRQDVNVTALLDAMGEGASDEWFTDAAHSAARSRNFTLGKQLAARISDPEQRARAATELAHVALEARDAALAEQIWCELAPQGPPPSDLVTAVAKSGRLDDALALLAGLTWGWREAAVDIAERLLAENRIDDALHLASTAAAFGSDRKAVAERVMAAVAQQAPEQLASVVTRLSPSGWDLRDAVRFTAQHDVEAAVRLAQFADWDRVDALRDAVLDRLDQGDVNGATVLTGALFQAPRRYSDAGRMLDVVEAFAVAGHPDEALAFAREAGVTLGEAQAIVAEVEMDSGDTARAKAIVAEALDGDAAPEPAVAARAAYVLARLGDTARAAELCRQVTRDAAPRAVILRASAACGLSDEAAALNDGTDYERNVGRIAIAAGLAAHGDSAGARAMLAEVDGSISWDRRAARDVTRLAVALLPPKEAASVFLRAGIADGRLLGLAVSGAVEHAAATLEAMNQYEQDTAFAEALPRLAARGDWRAAAMLAMAMTNRVEALSRLLVEAVTVQGLATALGEVRKVADRNDTALALRRAAQSVEGAAAEALLAEVPDEELQSAPTSVEQWIAAGDYVRAIELAMHFEEPYSRTHATAEVVAAAAERDGLEAALGFAASHEPERHDAIEYAARKLAREGKAIAADLILTLPIDGARWRAGWVAKDLAEHGNLDVALRIVDVFRGRDRTRVLGLVIEGAAVNAPDRALELATQIEDPEARMSAIAQIALAHARCGEGERAFELATSPRLDEASTADLTSIAVALLDAGRRDLSEQLLDRAIYAANSVTDRWRRNFVFRLLCDHALDRGDVTLAETLAAGILPVSVYRADARLEIARAQADAGRREAARATLRHVLTSLPGSRNHRRLATELDAAATLVALDGSAGIAEVKHWCRESQHGAGRIQALVQLTERQLAGRIRHFSSLPSSVRSGTTRRDRVVQLFVRLVQRFRVADLARTAEAELSACDSESERIIALGWLVFLRSNRGRARRAVAAAREIRDFALPQRPTDTRSIVLSQAAIALRCAGEEDESRAITEELLRTLPDIGDREELHVAVDWIALIAGRFDDGELAEALVRTVWQNNRHRAADAVSALANRLQKPKERIRAGRVLAELAAATDGADVDDIVAILQCAETDETLIDAAEHLANRADGDDALGAFCEGAVLLARNHSARAAHWIALAREHSEAAGIEPINRAYVAAKVAAAQSELGMRDEALASLGDAFRDGRLYDRDAFFEVLDVAIPALDRVDGGETLSRVVRRIIESESWWNHRLVEQ